MKFICAALLGLIATNALAGDDTKTLAYSKELLAAMVVAVCDAKTQPTPAIGAYGLVSYVYNAGTEDLHRCQYITETINSGCDQSGSCQGYEDWTRANPTISPALPRKAFLSGLEARKAELRTQGS